MARFKKKCKKKNSETKQIVRGTGGGPVPKILTKDEENIISIIETTTLEGDPEVLEQSVAIVRV